MSVRGSLAARRVSRGIPEQLPSRLRPLCGNPPLLLVAGRKAVHSCGVSSQRSTVERAFDLARTGTCRTIGQLRADLKAERCDGIEAHLAGRSMVRQLQAIMKAKIAT